MKSGGGWGRLDPSGGDSDRGLGSGIRSHAAGACRRQAPTQLRTRNSKLIGLSFGSRRPRGGEGGGCEAIEEQKLVL